MKAGLAMSRLPSSINVPAGSPPLSHDTWAPPANLIEAASGDDAFITELIDIFTMDAETRIGQVREALATSDSRKIQAAAHSIKGSASQVGADALADVCQELELASTLPGMLNIAGLVSRVEFLFEEIRHAMASYSSSSITHTARQLLPNGR